MTDLEIKYQQLLQPSNLLVKEIATLKGDIIILGVGGKMGPALARLAKQAINKAGVNKKVIGVARFTEPGLQNQLEKDGIETIETDLLNEHQLNELPNVPNVLYLAGTKFGTSGNESFTWAMNSYLPGRVAEKFNKSNIVAFSTGNVYPFVPVVSGGATEQTLPEPVGEYAQSCLGRERIFQHFSTKNNTPMLLYRLNYANDVSYGILHEIAKAVQSKTPVNLSMGAVNIIWQGDANEIALRSLHHCSVPARVLNVTGPEIISVRWLATEFGKMLGITPQFIHEEQPTALLSNAAECNQLFGYPSVTLKQMMEVILEWLLQGGKTLNKPTHFSERKGKF